MVKENFVQIPNKMFADTNNDEKLVYAILQYTQTVGLLDKNNRMTRTMIPLLVSDLGWSKGTRSNKKVVTALNGLKEKGYINFESTQDVFTVQINNLDNKEEHVVSVDWKSSGIKFSGFTKIKYSVIDTLLEDKSFTLYAYAEYRTMKEYQYRICYAEWAFVLNCKERQAFDIVNDSKVIVKVSNGFDSDTKRRETNSYLTFNSVEDEKEVSLKPTYKAQSSEAKEKETEKPVVKESKEDSEKEAKGFKDEIGKFFGNTMEDNIFKKMASDKRITSVEQAMEIQDINKPMSLGMWKVIKDSDNSFVRDYGNKKLKNKSWQKKFGSDLNEAIRKDKESAHKTKFTAKYLFKTITEYYEDGGKRIISADELYDYVHHRLVYSDSDTYFTPTNMFQELKCIKVTDKY